MNCREAKDVMVVSVYGKLTRSQQKALEIHFQECSACQNLYRQIESFRGLLDDTHEPPLPDWEKLWRSIANRVLKPRKQRRTAIIPLPQFAYVVAAMAAVFVIGFFAGKNILLRNSSGYSNAAKAYALQTSPILTYAERTEFFLTSFMNQGEPAKEKAVVEFENRIISDILFQTRLLKRIISTQDEPPMQDLLEDLETILISISNLRPEDKEAAGQLHRLIQEKQVNNRLGRLIESLSI